MAVQTNYFKIGVFVIVCVIIFVVGLAFLGAGVFSSKSLVLETYINESVQGLTIGSDVNERGVIVGIVTDIKFVPQEYHITPEDGGYEKFGRYVLIIMSVDRDKFLGGAADPQKRLDELVRGGLRFHVTQQGLTGVARMDADYFDPEKYPPLEFPWTPKHTYVPSAPSALSVVTESIQKTLDSINSIDFRGISSSIEAAARSVSSATADAHVTELRQNLNELITEARRTNAALLSLIGTPARVAQEGGGGQEQTPDLREVLDNINKTAASLNKAIEDAKIQPLREQALELMKEAREASTEIHGLAVDTRKQIKAADLPKVIGNFDNALRQLSSVLTGERADLEATLLNLREATENLVEVSNLARRYPSQILFGGPPPKVENKK